MPPRRSSAHGSRTMRSFVPELRRAPPPSLLTTSAARRRTGAASSPCSPGARRPSPARASLPEAEREPGDHSVAKLHVQATINGEPAEFLCEPVETLLDVL